MVGVAFADAVNRTIEVAEFVDTDRFVNLEVRLSRWLSEAAAQCRVWSCHFPCFFSVRDCSTWRQGMFTWNRFFRFTWLLHCTRISSVLITASALLTIFRLRGVHTADKLKLVALLDRCAVPVSERKPGMKSVCSAVCSCMTSGVL
jgi:hypothetical protein